MYDILFEENKNRRKEMNMMKLVMAILAISITSVFAELKIYEGFDYAEISYPYDLPPNDMSELNGGTGWLENSVWKRSDDRDVCSVLSDSLAFTGVVTSGNKFSEVGTKGTVSRSVASFSTTSSDILWFGALFKLTSSKLGRYAGVYFRNSSYVNQFYFYAPAGSTIKVGGGSATEIDTGINPGTSTRFVIFKLDYTQTTPTASVWIDPTDLSSEVALGTPTTQIVGIGGSFASVKFAGSSTNPSYYDELRLGTTLEDAWKTLPPVIPAGTVLIIK
jgi:hypothetical protein